MLDVIFAWDERLANLIRVEINLMTIKLVLSRV